jgi:hypothetical protein
MARPIYTIRVTNNDEGVVAWIDVNGAPSIMQPHLPGHNTPFATEAEAQAWADEHVAELEARNDAAEAAEARKKELEDAQLAALQAQVTQAAALTAILERLTNPTA